MGTKGEFKVDLDKVHGLPEYDKWKYLRAGKYDVCEEWKNFSGFYLWANDRPDLTLQLTCLFVGDGRLHSPETSIFVPRYILQSLRANKSDRGVECGIPMGVTKNNRGDKYRGRVGVQGKIHRGPSRVWPEDAHRDWQGIKVDCLHETIKVYRKEIHFDQRVEDKLLSMISRLESDMELGIETKSPVWG